MNQSASCLDEQSKAGPKFSVIIVNYNSGKRLAKCLLHLRTQSCQDFETIVIDNASTDRSFHAAQDRRDITLIRAADNLGFAGGNNLAARRARGEWLICLNPDAYPFDDWLEAIAAGTVRYPGADAFGSLQCAASDPTRLDGAGDVLSAFGVAYRGGHGAPLDQAPPDAECFAPCAAAAAYRRSVFNVHGGFDERFFCYGEDVDLGFRLRLAGRRCIQLNAARVLHEGSGISGRHSPFTIYHGHRNRIWLFAKNAPTDLFEKTRLRRKLFDAALRLRFREETLSKAYNDALRDGYSEATKFAEERPDGLLTDYPALASLISWSLRDLLHHRVKTVPISEPPQLARY